MTTLNLVTFCERDNSGSLDVEETVKKFRGIVNLYKVERETEHETVATHVHALFDDNLGAYLNTPFIVGRVLGKMNVQSETQKLLTKRVHDYLQANTGKRETGVAFGMRKGPGGGICRHCDMIEKSGE